MYTDIKEMIPGGAWEYYDGVTRPLPDPATPDNDLKSVGRALSGRTALW